MPYHVIVKRKYTVAAIEVIGDDWTSDCPSLNFLAASYKDANTMASCKGFRALFELLADRGPQGVTSAMMHEANKPHVYLTNGYLKASQKADAAEIAKAIRAKVQFLESRK